MTISHGYLEHNPPPLFFFSHPGMTITGGLEEGELESAFICLLSTSRGYDGVVVKAFEGSVARGGTMDQTPY